MDFNFNTLFHSILLIFAFLLLSSLFSGSGFVSQDLYLHGFFSASIKLPSDYTAGVVVAFYVSFFLLCFLLVILVADYLLV